MPTATATVYPDGTGIVELDTTPTRRIQAPTLGQARQEALALIIQYAHESRTSIEVLAREPDAEYRLRVHPDGHVEEAPTPQPTPPPGEELPILHASAAGPPPRQPQREKRAIRRPPGLALPLRRPTPRLLGAGVLVIVLIAGTLLGLNVVRANRGGGPVEIVHGQQVGAPVPAEWSATSMWRTPALLSAAGRVLVVDAREVAVVSADRRLALVEAGDGRVRWVADYPQGQPVTALADSTVDGQRVIAAQVGRRLVWWDLATGAVGGVELPETAIVSFAGSAPLVTSEDGRRAWLVAGGALAGVDVPQGARTLAGRSDGVVTAASGEGWWHLRPGQSAGSPGQWEMPGPARTPQVVAYLGGTVICLLPDPDPTLREVLVLLDREEVNFFWRGAGRIGAGDTEWLPSPSRQWGILGRTLIDNQRTATTDLGAWTTHAVASDRAEGQVGGYRAITIARQPLPLGQLAEDEGFPEDLTQSGALVRSESDGASYLYHLPPRLP